MPHLLWDDCVKGCIFDVDVDVYTDNRHIHITTQTTDIFILRLHHGEASHLGKVPK